MLKLLATPAVPRHYKSQYGETPSPSTTGFYRSAFLRADMPSLAPHLGSQGGGLWREPLLGAAAAVSLSAPWTAAPRSWKRSNSREVRARLLAPSYCEDRDRSSSLPRLLPAAGRAVELREAQPATRSGAPRCRWVG